MKRRINLVLRILCTVGSLVMFTVIMWRDLPMTTMDLALFLWIWAIELRMEGKEE